MAILFTRKWQYNIHRIIRKGKESMISYEPLWKTLKRKNVTTYKLIKDYNLSRGILDKLKHNRNVNVDTIGRLCEMLDCNVEDVMEYRKDV